MACYALLVALYLWPRPSVENLDFWRFLDLGLAATIERPITLVDGLYPIGYPLLLGAAVSAGVDSLRAAQVLSWLGGALCVSAAYLMTRQVTGSGVWSALAAILVLTNSHFLVFASREGGDMLSAGLQASAIALLVRRAGRPSRLASLAGSGALLGLAYLVRYQALGLLPVAMAAAWALSPGSWRQRARGILLLVLGFAATSAPQTLPSVITHGTPFFNQQAKNVWFGIYGESDWVSRWSAVPDAISLPEVIALDVGRFLGHWWEQLFTFVSTPMLWQTVGHLGWLLGALSLAWDKRLNPAQRGLVLVALTVPAAAASMAWLQPRFTLSALPLQAMLIAAVAARLAGWRDLQGRRRLLRAAVASTLAILLVQQLIWVGEWLRSPVRNQPQAVNATLRAHGMNDAARVLTNDPYLHDTDHPARTRYTQVYWAAPEAATLADLPLHPNSVGWQFIAVNRQNGLGAAGLRAHTDRPEALAELGRVGSIVLYCVRPCLSGSKPPGA